MLILPGSDRRAKTLPTYLFDVAGFLAHCVRCGNPPRKNLEGKIPRGSHSRASRYNYWNNYDRNYWNNYDRNYWNNYNRNYWNNYNRNYWNNYDRNY